MNSAEIMVQPVVTITQETTLMDAARLLIEHRFGCLPVVDGQGKLRGIVTESDFAAKERAVPFSTLFLPQVLNQWMPPDQIENVYKAARQTKVEKIMSKNPRKVSEDSSVDDVIKMMLRHDINHVPVVRDDVPVGIISRHDLLRMMVESAGPAPDEASS